MGKIVACLKSVTTSTSIFESEPLFDAESPDQCTNSSVEAMMTYLQVTSRADVSRVIDRLARVSPRRARGGAAGCPIPRWARAKWRKSLPSIRCSPDG